jgi:3-hydroxybutyryl-CoA dehydratase
MILPEIGKEVKFVKVFSSEEVMNFAQTTEDNNLIHLDEDYAKGTMFGKRIVHGMLVASMFSKIFGTIYPGKGCLYYGQTIEFRKPVFLDSRITAIATLTKYDEEKKIGVFKTEAFNEEGKLVINGEAKIVFPNL